MSKLKWRITPVNGCDIPGLERWLEAQTAKGLLFSMTMGPLTLFEAAQPRPLRVHLEPIRGRTEEDPELNALYEAAGWRYLGRFRNDYFVFTSEDLQAQAHTDPGTLDYALGRFFRQKLLAGLGLLAGNLFLLAFYRPGYISWTMLRWFPIETFSTKPLIPLLLSILGLALVDLSYLSGLYLLCRQRRDLKAGRPPRKGGRRSGILLAAGTLVLIPVVLNTASYFLGLDYRPFPLEGSGVVTLAEIQGPGFTVTGDSMYNMDYVSHEGTLLDLSENWYHRQYGAFAHYEGNAPSVNEVPHLELQICRYRLPGLAAAAAEEQSHIQYGGTEFQPEPPAFGLDQVMVARGEGRMQMVLRRGSTVLRADYRGDRDLTDYLERFAEMLAGL